MSNNCKDIAKILLAEGTNQLQRNELALDPTTLKIHGFGMEEWMKFAENFAGHLHFYKATNSADPDGDWKDFYPAPNEIAGIIKSLEEADNLTPHLTLFVCFLKLLELPNQRLNNLTKRHLDYYYQEVLQIEKLPATYDKVHILFELSKSIMAERFQEGVKLNGGKDGIGKLRIYELIEELAGNKATIGSLRNFYMAPALGATQPYVKAALMANSADGLGADLPEGETEWYPFGYDVADPGINTEVFEELQDAKIGFAIASEALLMSEGERHVQFTIEFEEDLPSFDRDELINNISVFYTGEKTWVNLLNEPSIDVSDPENIPALLRNSSAYQNVNYATSATGKNLKLYTLVDIDFESVTNYNSTVHGESYNTEKPMFRFLIDVSKNEGKNLIKTLSGKIKSITVDITVNDMYNLKLQNDLGILNPSKPMYPFTTNPIDGSNFTLESEEIFQKDWSTIELNITWKNAPALFDAHYQGYNEPLTLSSSSGGSSGSSGGQVKNLVVKSKQNKIGIKYNAAFPALMSEANYDGKYNYFQSRRGIRVNNSWANAPKSRLFTTRDEDQIYHTKAQFEYTNFTITDKVEAIRLQLASSFFHDVYPEIYAIAIAKKVSAEETVLPNKPYTPYAEEITVRYVAKDKVSFNTDATSYDQTTVLFHEHPFGQSEEHTSIKATLDFVSDKKCTLLPAYSPGGELYIGLQNALPLQNIPLLFQISEGTENTEKPTFGTEDGIVWEVLCNNHWKSFENSEILKNEVDNFLKTGIVSLKLPKEVTSDNTLLPTGHQWIRARMPCFRYDTVCKFIGIHSQVVLAQFTNNGNETSHLETGLPAETIAKLIERSSAVKSIFQPYNSFGGSLEENDNSYYRRVSERLRHKKRAVTIWDYEHLVLQYFTDIYRAKCLSHTNSVSFNAAGSVTMVVIPDTVNKNVFNIFEPRVSTAYLNEIKTFLSQYTSLHVDLRVINPQYEAVKIKTTVRFNSGYDDLLYQSVLKEDITKLLAPWAFDETKQVEFGGTLHKTVLIDYIENLAYIDYIETIGIYVPKNGNDGENLLSYTASSPFSILVSSREHEVEVAALPCATKINDESKVDCE